MVPIVSKTWGNWNSSGLFIIGFFRSLLWAWLLKESLLLLKEISVLSVFATSLILLYFTIKSVQKTRATFSTNCVNGGLLSFCTVPVMFFSVKTPIMLVALNCRQSVLMLQMSIALAGAA